MTRSTSPRYISLPSRTAEIMKAYQLDMKKSLGQNFLVEPKILQRMVEVAGITDQTTVIEIGPGIGALTEFLALEAKKVYSFEIDQRFVEILKETLADYSNVQVVGQDFLKVDLHDVVYQDLQIADRLVVVANLPYYITTPIIMKLIESNLPFQSLVMLMQKEVAERMTASVGTKAYNSLTIAIQRTHEARLAFTVPRQVFIPKPNVDSAVLELRRRPQALVEVADPMAFQAFVQACFTQRRKTLWNNLKANYLKGRVTAEDLAAGLDQAGISGQRRAETLTLEDFAHLYHALQDKIAPL